MEMWCVYRKRIHRRFDRICLPIRTPTRLWPSVARSELAFRESDRRTGINESATDPTCDRDGHGVSHETPVHGS